MKTTTTTINTSPSTPVELNALTSDYLTAQMVEEDRIGPERTRRRHAERLNWVLVPACLLLTVGFILERRQQKVVPYLTVLDQQGKVIAVATQLSHASSKQQDDVIRELLQQWISDVRQVTTDYPAMIARATTVMHRVDDRPGKARTTVEHWYLAHPPDTRAKTEVVTVQPNAFLRQSEETFELDWTETAEPIAGGEPVVTRWKGLFRVAFRPDDATIATNPTGFYITELHWSQTQ